MMFRLLAASVVVAILAACASVSVPTRTPAPTPTPTPRQDWGPSGSPFRLDLKDGVVASFEWYGPQENAAFITHVPTGAQVKVDESGQVLERHDGRGDGKAALDAVLADQEAMHTVLKGLAAANGKPPEMVDWTDFIKFEGIVYQSIRGPGPPRIPGERTFTEADLGDLLYRVAFRVQDYVGVSYRAQDGDSGFLVPGTPVFAVKDYSPRFRLAALQDGKVLVFEADFNRNARTGADLLDIEGKVRAVTFYDETEPNYMDNEIARVDEPGVVADIVSMVMAAPVDQSQLDRGDERYLVVFWLDDGSAVARWYRLESGRLSRGIQLPAEFAKYLPSGGEGE